MEYKDLEKNTYVSIIPQNAFVIGMYINAFFRAT